MRALFPITLFLISAPLILRLAAQPQPAAAEKLQHALRLADLYNWADAGPDFAEAETLFLAAGDQRNALYAGSASSDRTASNTLFLKHRRN